MALTRSMLKGMGLTEEQVSAIIDAHTETVDGLKDSLKAAKADADKLKAVQKELDDLKANDGDDYKSKYEKEHSDFEEYKKTVASEKATAEKRSLYRKLLKEAGVKDDFIDDALDLAREQIDKAVVEEGALKDADKLSGEAKKRFEKYIAQTDVRGANVSNPPTNNGAKKTKAEIMAIKDAKQRQQEIAENHELFGF